MKTFNLLSLWSRSALISLVWPLAMSALEAIRWRQGPPAVLQLLDQRLLPLQTVYIDIDGPESAWHAIKVCRIAALMVLISRCLVCAEGWSYVQQDTRL